MNVIGPAMVAEGAASLAATGASANLILTSSVNATVSRLEAWLMTVPRQP